MNKINQVFARTIICILLLSSTVNAFRLIVTKKHPDEYIVKSEDKYEEKYLEKEDISAEVEFQDRYIVVSNILKTIAFPLIGVGKDYTNLAHFFSTEERNDSFFCNNVLENIKNELQFIYEKYFDVVKNRYHENKDMFRTINMKEEVEKQIKVKLNKRESFKNRPEKDRETIFESEVAEELSGKGYFLSDKDKTKIVDAYIAKNINSLRKNKELFNYIVFLLKSRMLEKTQEKDALKKINKFARIVLIADYINCHEYKESSKIILRKDILSATPDTLSKLKADSYYSVEKLKESFIKFKKFISSKKLKTFNNDFLTIRPIFSPSGEEVLFGDMYGKSMLCGVETGENLKTFEYNSVILCAAFSPDGKKVLIGYSDGKAILWDVETGENLKTFEYNSGISCAAFSPYGKEVLIGDVHEKAILWDVETGENLKTFEYNSGISCAAFSPYGKEVLIGGHDNKAILWDVETGENLKTFDFNFIDLKFVAFSLDGKKVFLFSDKSFVSFDKETKNRLITIHFYRGCIDIALSPDRTMVLTGLDSSLKQGAVIYDVETGKELRQFKNKVKMAAIAFSPDGGSILAGPFSSRRENYPLDAKLWDVDTGDLLQRFECNGRVRWVVFSPDGSKVLITAYSNDSWLFGNYDIFVEFGDLISEAEKRPNML